jgi:hypothetical protein
MTEEFEPNFEEQEGGPRDSIAFGIGAHPITGEPLLIMEVRDKSGGRAQVSMPVDQAIQTAASLQHQANILGTLVYMAQAQAAAQQQQGIVLPGQG